MNATNFRYSKIITIISFLLIFSLAIPQVSSAFYWSALKMFGSFLGGRFLEKVFDRSGLGQLIDQTMEQLFRERREIRQLPNYYPKTEKEEQLRLTNDAIKVIEDMRKHLYDRRLSDTELIAKLQAMNQQQIMPLIQRLDAIEQRVYSLETKVTNHEHRFSDVAFQIKLQQERLKDSEIYANDLTRKISQIDSMAQTDRKQVLLNFAQVNQRLNEHDQKLTEHDKKFDDVTADGKRRDIEDKQRDFIIANILKTHFHFYYNGLYFKPEFWQNHFQNQPIADYQEILFEGAGSGLSLLIERRIRIYGDLYYMLSKPKMPRQKFDAAGNPLLNEVNISGIGANALANVVFFPKRWLSLELGGGYGWTFYTISDQLDNQTLNEYQFRTRGMLGAVTITFTGKKMAVFGQGIGVLRGKEVMYGLAKGGISIIF